MATDEKFKRFIHKTIMNIGNFSKSKYDSNVRNVIDNHFHHFITAFTSHRENANDNYQMLEFLGDSTISCFITYYLWTRFPQLRGATNVNYMSKLKGTLVSSSTLSKIAKQLGFTDYLITNAGVNFKLDALLEDTFEAFIGAINLAFDHEYGLYGIGFGAAYGLLTNLYDNETIELTFEATMDPKTILKELGDAHPEWGGVTYRDDIPLKRSGIFLGETCIAYGFGQNNKIRHQDAAKKGLVEISRLYGVKPKTGDLFFVF